MRLLPASKASREEAKFIKKQTHKYCHIICQRIVCLSLVLNLSWLSSYSSPSIYSYFNCLESTRIRHMKVSLWYIDHRRWSKNSRKWDHIKKCTHYQQDHFIKFLTIFTISYISCIIYIFMFFSHLKLFSRLMTIFHVNIKQNFFVNFKDLQFLASSIGSFHQICWNFCMLSLQCVQNLSVCSNTNSKSSNDTVVTVKPVISWKVTESLCLKLMYKLCSIYVTSFVINNTYLHTILLIHSLVF